MLKASLNFINEMKWSTVTRRERSRRRRRRVKWWMNERKSFFLIHFAKRKVLRDENDFRRLRESCVIIKHHHTNVHVVYSQKSSPSLPIFLLLFLYSTLGRKTSCSVLVLDTDESRRRLWVKKKSQRVYTPVVKNQCRWMVAYRDWYSVTRHFQSIYITWNTSHTSKCFQGFSTLKKTALSKLKLVKSRLVIAYGASDVGMVNKVNEFIVFASGGWKTR